MIKSLDKIIASTEKGSDFARVNKLGQSLRNRFYRLKAEAKKAKEELEKLYSEGQRVVEVEEPEVHEDIMRDLMLEKK